jgi:maltooligosyltrehalose trehalohydrolase
MGRRKHRRMKRRHDMPFGAECLPNGSVRFRLWAPAADEVKVHLANTYESVNIPLDPHDTGWFELVTDAAGAGTRYQFKINDGLEVPDPASRFQPRDVHGPSEVIDPDAFDWQDLAWQGRPWEDVVIYELHVGAFTPQGTFAGLGERLDYLSELGVTALELMPVADFPGQRNWGYDGVFPFAPDSTYGRPEDFKKLIQNAHQRGIMVFLDVVYNHFGPEGNYLGSYAPQFFTDRHHTPWGNGLNFDGLGSRVVRDFFVHNALYWLHEYHLDGLRLDAVHAIADDSTPHILQELADAVRTSLSPDRHVHLILENDRNQSSYLRRDTQCHPKIYTAQWNDDIHHSLHVLLTGERDGYYRDYSERPLEQLARCLIEGFAYQGEPSIHRNGQLRGECTDELPPTAFVSFLQNHDQIGNRAFGERITKIADPSAVRAAVALILLAPSPPMLFMGEEFGADTPFLFFCDFKGDLAAAVTTGRQAEFDHFSGFGDPVDGRQIDYQQIPDPNAIATFEASRLDWQRIDETPHREWLATFQQLLRLRREHIIPRLTDACNLKAECKVLGDHGLRTHWQFSDSSELTFLANLGTAPMSISDIPQAPIIYASSGLGTDSLNRNGLLPAWSVVWFLQS